MPPPTGFEGLESAVLDACARRAEWPAQVAAAIYAGVDFAIAHPELVDQLSDERGGGAAEQRRYDLVISRLAYFLREKAPAGQRLPGSTDEALVGGVVGLVGDHLRIGRTERLARLRPDLVLLTLLPYLGFDEARRWANELAEGTETA
jgi:hypothetical protein